MPKKHLPRHRTGAPASGGHATPRRWRWLVPTAAGIIALACAAAFAAVALWPRGADDAAPPDGPPRAAIVDQLAATDRNPAFVLRATRLLEDAGYAVDYYPPEAVTVDLYRQLPSRGYGFVLLRSHSARNPHRGRETGPTSLGLFTNEPYAEYGPLRGDVRGRRLLEARYPGGAESWFAIGPEFIARSARGRFDGTTVVLMGCDGLSNDEMAKAFVSKGAESFVSWDDEVSAAHTDAASETLLDKLLLSRLTPGEAVASTMALAGPDPTYGARLVAYP